MTRFRLIFSVISLFLLANLCGCGSSQRISWHLKPGDTYSVKVHLISDLSMIFGGVDHKDSEMLLNCRVKEADPRQILIEVTIASIKASMSSLGKKFSFDSSQAPSPESPTKSKTEQKQTFTNAFAGLKGKKFTVRMNSRLPAAELVEMDPLIEKAAYAGSGGNMIGGDQVNMLLAEGNLREYVTGGLLVGPKAPSAKSNATWESPGSVLVPYAPVTPTIKSYTVENIEKQQDNQEQQVGRVALIKYNLTCEQMPSAPAKPDKPRKSRRRTSKLTFNVASVEGQGDLTFSLSNGRPIKLTEKTRVFVSSRTRSRSRRPSPAKLSGTKDLKPKIFYTVQKTIEYMDN